MSIKKSDPGCRGGKGKSKEVKVKCSAGTGAEGEIVLGSKHPSMSPHIQ